IVAVNGASLSIADLPMSLPFDGITGFAVPDDMVFEHVNFSMNGNSATVYGVELPYSKYFDNGLFVSSNATLMESKADVGQSIRASKIQLPDQADTTLNLTLGWERDGASVRLSANHRSK